MQYEYWLAGVKHLSNRKKIYLDTCYGAEAVFGMTPEQLKRIPLLEEKEAEAILASHQLWNWEKTYEYCIQYGIHLVSWNQSHYPKQLKNIYNPPYSLFYRGSLPDEKQKTAAIVGARNCSEYGKLAAEKIGYQLSQAGFGIVSGMAAGIDSAGHRGAQKAQGKTYAILGCGVNICYPARNREIYEKLIKTGGVISEYPPDTQPLPAYFPQRNRIISGLSEVVIVVEAKEKSGSLITADFALEQGKDVYAVPGRISDELSSGTNRLIQQGAGIYWRTEDFLKEMNVFAQSHEPSRDGKFPLHFVGNSEKNLELALEKMERLVYSCVDLTPRNLEDIMTETGLNLSETIQSIEGLQEKGYISELYKNYFIRSDINI